MRRFIGEFRCAGVNLNKGDLLIVLLDGKMIYARFSHIIKENNNNNNNNNNNLKEKENKNNNNNEKNNEKNNKEEDEEDKNETKLNYYCYIEGDESGAFPFTVDQIYPIAKKTSIYKTISKYDFEENFYEGFDHLIFVDHIETENNKKYYFKSIQEMFEKTMEQFLTQFSSISSSFIRHLFTAIQKQSSSNKIQFWFEDLENLKEILRILKEVSEKIPQNFLDSIQSIVDEKIKDVQMKIRSKRIFQLNLYKVLKLLIKLEYEKIVKANVHRIIEVCDQAFNQLNTLKSEILSGLKKERLVGWWLNEIDNSVKLFLEARFVFYFYLFLLFIN